MKVAALFHQYLLRFNAIILHADDKDFIPKVIQKQKCVVNMITT